MGRRVGVKMWMYWIGGLVEYCRNKLWCSLRKNRIPVLEDTVYDTTVGHFFGIRRDGIRDAWNGRGTRLSSIFEYVTNRRGDGSGSFVLLVVLDEGTAGEPLLHHRAGRTSYRGVGR
jgi:hypothetical protein